MLYDYEVDQLRDTLKNVRTQIGIVDDILYRYVNDEAGENSKKIYEEMLEEEKFNLITYTIENCACWEDFEAELVTNFEVGRY